ncbi:hypothetical protein [Rhodocista pekingensis]|uniref:Uncharacterized protein n=1 Tax=Rhodocista pekingensis TaxID=201185 RepID=A0ABW2L2X9_9PROT
MRHAARPRPAGRPPRLSPAGLAVLLAVPLTLPATAGPARAQADSSGPRAERELPQTAPEPLGDCRLNANLLEIMIDPAMESIPLWVRPFTSCCGPAPELVALRERCAVEEWRRVLVDWTGRGPGVRPRGEDSDRLIEKEPRRPGLDEPAPGRTGPAGLR